MTTQTDLPTADEIRSAEGDDLSRLFHRVVLGDDLIARSDEQIGRAVMSGFAASHGNGFGDFSWNCRLHAPETCRNIPLPSGGYGYRSLANDGYGLKLWEMREGQIWQSQIEAHVAAWRAAPRPWATDCGLLEEACELLKVKGLWVRISNDAKWLVEIFGNVGNDCDRISFITHESLATVFCRAACLAVLVRGGIDEESASHSG